MTFRSGARVSKLHIFLEFLSNNIYLNIASNTPFTPLMGEYDELVKNKLVAL